MSRQSFGGSDAFTWPLIRPYLGEENGPVVDAAGVLGSFCQRPGVLGSEDFEGEWGRYGPFRQHLLDDGEHIQGTTKSGRPEVN